MSTAVELPKPHVPSYQALACGPALDAIRALGGSGTKGAIYDKLISLEKYSPEQLARLTTRGSEGEIRSRLSWALSDLKNIGALKRIGQREWMTTPLGDTIAKPDLADTFNRYRRERMERAGQRKSQTALAASE